MYSHDSILDTKPREYVGDTITIMNEQLIITDYTLDRKLLFKLKE